MSVATGAATAGRAPLMPVVGLVALAGACILFSLRPHVLFLGWFIVAPLLQESASRTSLGRLLNLALYQAPSLVFIVWTLTRRPARLRPTAIDALPLLFLFDVYVSLVVAGNTTTPFVRFVYMNIGMGIGLYYLFALGPIGALTTQRVTAGILLVTIMEGVMSIVDGLAKWNLWHDTSWQGPSRGISRAIATFGNPAALGTLLGMGIVVSVSILVWNGPLRLRRPAIVTLIVGFPGLYMTFTRGPIIGTVLGVIVVLLSRPKTRLLAAACATLAVVIIIGSWGYISASEVYQNRITNSGNVNIRRDLERWSWKLAEKRPVFGWGFNSFDRAKAEAGFAAEDLQLNGTSSSSHNTYLTVLVEYGFVGFFLFIGPWIVIAWRSLKAAVNRPEARWYTTAALSALLVYVIAANTLDFKSYSFIPAVSWALLGILRRAQLAKG
jgi:O-antigen ligase